MRRCFLLLLICVLSWQALASAGDTLLAPKADRFALKDIVETPEGFLANTGSDGYLTLASLKRSRAQLCGLELELEFQQPLPRPALFEIFWRSPQTNFSENEKALFIINQQDSTTITNYFVPLCKLFHYSGNINNGDRQALIEGLRLDYPSNKTVAIKFHSITFVDAATTASILEQRPDELKILEPYERLSAAEFMSLDVALPKMVFAFEEGLNHLAQDVGFLIFWLMLMLIFLVLIVRSVFYQYFNK
jgi:hypothetical protein